jgi:GNAT superfamily N-acetyltransferase
MPLRLTGASFCPGVRSSHDSGYLAEISLTRSQRDDQPVAFHVDPPVASWELDELFAASWCRHEPRDWNPVMKRSLVYVCAYREERLVGFVNVAWDGGVHGFVLDTTVHPEMQCRGIGRRLVLRAATEARTRNLEWLHVDFEPHLRRFYDLCGFRPTEAGLLRL